MNRREIAYHKNNEFFLANPYKKIDFFVWEDPEQAEKMFNRPLGWANPDMCVVNSKKDQTPGHEITHILTFYGIPPTKKSPLINEGVAVYFNCTTENKMDIAKASLEKKGIDVIDLWTNLESYPHDYNYTIGGALINYLLENGTTDQLKKLLKNQTIEEAREIYPDFDQLIEAFEVQFRINR